MPQVAAAITQALDLFTRLGRTDLQEDLQEIEGRLERRVLSVALVGQFKRGKTSLLNALIGEEILPTGVLPITAIVTQVRWGEALRATVRLQDGSEVAVSRDEIPLYATEVGNPKNIRGVRDILVNYPAELLAQGIELVDTPGIGSIWAHNTNVATEYLPWVDVALFVVSPDPPITDVERQFLEDARQHAGKVIVVLSKSDLLPSEDLDVVRRFIADAVGDALGMPVPVLTASVLQGRQAGLEEIAQRLRELAQNEGESMALALASRRIEGVLHRLAFDFDLQRAAYTTPQALRAQRHAALQGLLGDFDAALEMYKGAWQSAFRGVTQAYDTKIEALKGPILEALRSGLDEQLQASGHPRTLYLGVATELEARARTQLEQMRDDLRRITPELLTGGAQPLVGQIQSWIERFAQATADLFELPAVTIELPLEIRESRGFSFKWQDDPGLLPTLAVPVAVVVLPTQPAVKAATRSLEERMDWFVDRNIGRLHYHFHESLKTEWHHLWQRIETVLRRLEDALVQAASTLSEDDPEARERLTAIESVLGEIDRIKGSLVGPSDRPRRRKGE
jgi:GTPase SAR1 family protein